MYSQFKFIPVYYRIWLYCLSTKKFVKKLQLELTTTLFSFVFQQLRLSDLESLITHFILSFKTALTLKSLYFSKGLGVCMLSLFWRNKLFQYTVKLEHLRKVRFFGFSLLYFQIVPSTSFGNTDHCANKTEGVRLIWTTIYALVSR